MGVRIEHHDARGFVEILGQWDPSHPEFQAQISEIYNSDREKLKKVTFLFKYGRKVSRSRRTRVVADVRVGECDLGTNNFIEVFQVRNVTQVSFHLNLRLLS